MQKLISKYGLAAHLAFVAVAPLFLFPFFGSGAVATASLALTVFALVWVLMEPSRRTDEMLHDARQRVAGAMVRDPLFWTLLVLVALSALCWANGGVAIKCDFNGGSPFWYLREPDCKYLPGSVNGTGYPVFVTALMALVLVQGCGHALGKSARISFLFTSSTLAGVAALVALTLAVFGNTAALAAAWCADWNPASFVGTAFGLQLVAGVTALFGALELGWNRQVLLFLLAIGGTAAGLFFFAPVPVILLFFAAALVELALGFAHTALREGLTAMAKCAVLFFISILIPLLVVLGVMFLGEECADALAARVRTVKVAHADEAATASRAELAQAALYLVSSNRLAVATGGTLLPAHFGDRRKALSGVAQRIWSDHPWVGAGLGAYPHALRFAATSDDWGVFNPTKDDRSLAEQLKELMEDTDERERVGGYVTLPSDWRMIGAGRVSNPFNGWWKLLSERGLIGALGLVAALALLVFHFVRRLIGGWRKNVFLPSCATGFIVLFALVAETFLDASFLRPEVLAVTAAFLAVSVSSFPPVRKSPKSDGVEKDG